MPAEHQHRDRIVDHRLVVDRQELLVDRERHRMEARSRAAGEHDTLHDALFAFALRASASSSIAARRPRSRQAESRMSRAKRFARQAAVRAAGAPVSDSRGRDREVARPPQLRAAQALEDRLGKAVPVVSDAPASDRCPRTSAAASRGNDRAIAPRDRGQRSGSRADRPRR